MQPLEGRARPPLQADPDRSAAPAWALHLESLLVVGLLWSWGPPKVVVGAASAGGRCAPAQQRQAQQRPDAARSGRRSVAPAAPVALKEIMK
eukprot:COSAG01_NODE_26259_length_719_cov_2.788710_1_plen_92_part_00